jgi:hypothetical protein
LGGGRTIENLPFSTGISKFGLKKPIRRESNHQTAGAKMRRKSCLNHTILLPPLIPIHFDSSLAENIHQQGVKTVFSK